MFAKLYCIITRDGNVCLNMKSFTRGGVGEETRSVDSQTISNNSKSETDPTSLNRSFCVL